MKNIIGFLSGLLILVMSAGILYFAGALFNAGDMTGVDAYVFQSADLSTNRLPKLLSPAQLGESLECIDPDKCCSDSKVCESLLKKFVHEYFYAAPDQGDIARRRAPYGIMAAMSNADVFAEWKRGEAEAIKELSAQRKLRNVIIDDKITHMGDYWRLEYQLLTWTDSNDMEAKPKSSRGAILLKVQYLPGIREMINGNPFNAEKYLRRGGDAAAVFRFTVVEVK